jgi:hypothetical protein
MAVQDMGTAVTVVLSLVTVADQDGFDADELNTNYADFKGNQWHAGRERALRLRPAHVRLNALAVNPRPSGSKPERRSRKSK